MSKLKSILSRLISDNSFRDSFLKDAVSATKEYNLSETELSGLQAIDISNMQDIEERVSKSFIATDTFTTIMCGSGGSGSGSGSGGSGSGSGSGSGGGW